MFRGGETFCLAACVESDCHPVDPLSRLPMTRFPSLIALAFWLCADAAPCRGQAESTGVAAYVDGRLADKNPGASKAILAAGDFNTGRGWQRNPNLWCADLDLTCFSPWNSTEHNLQGGTLITRQHVLLANHISNPYTGTPPMIPGITTIKFLAVATLISANGSGATHKEAASKGKGRARVHR